MGHFTTLLLLSGAAVAALAHDQSGTQEKRSAADDNQISSQDDLNSKLSGFASSFPGSNANQYGLANLPKLPGMGQPAESSATAEKTKRSAADGTSVSSLDDLNSKLSGFASSFPGSSANQYGLANLPKLPGMGQPAESSATAEKTKRSAADGTSVSSLDDLNSKLSGFASSFPGSSANQYGLANLPKLPGMGQPAESSATAEKTKRSAADGTSVSSLDDLNSKLSGFASSFPGSSANQYGLANLPKLPGMGQPAESSATAEKTKRSAADGTSVSSLDDLNSKLSGFASSFPGSSANQYGLANLPKLPGMGQPAESSATAEKTKRSAADGTSVSSLDDLNSKLSGFASSFPGSSANQHGLANLPKLPGMGQPAESSATAEKTKRSAADGTSVSSLDDLNSKLSGFASSFPGSSANQYGIANLPKLPGMGQPAESSATAEKTKRSAADGTSVSSLDDLNSKLSGFASSFPGSSANQYGLANLPKLPGMGQPAESSATAEKTKRSAADGTSVSSLDDLNSKLSGFASSFPGSSANQYGLANLPKLPGMGQPAESSATAEKTKRSAADGTSVSSLDDLNSKLSGFASSFPGSSANQYGLANLPKLPGMGQPAESSATAEKTKRSAADGTSVSSLDDLNSKLSGFASSFPGSSANQYGIANLPKLPGMGQPAESSATAEKTKRSAADGTSVSSLDDLNSKLSGFASSFPGSSANQYGLANLPKLPGMGQPAESSATAEKTKRSAADGTSVSSLDDLNSKLSGFASSFPGSNANQYGLANLPKLPGMGQPAESSATAEKTKRSAADGTSVSSLDDLNSKLSGFASSFPGSSANQYGLANLPKLPGMGQPAESSATAEKTKRSAADGTSVSSLDDLNSKLSGFASSFPGSSANQYGLANLPKLPGMGQPAESSATAEKTKRSSNESSPSWTEKLKSLFTGSGAE